jgi:hypothetical protein
LSILVQAEIGSLVKPGAKKPSVIDHFRSVVIVAALMPRNPRPGSRERNFRVQPVDRQPAVGPVAPGIGAVLRQYVPDPAEVAGRRGTALVDGTVCPVWDWGRIPDLFSGKVKYAGMNVQIACSLDGNVAAIGPVPLHGARRDAYAFEASGLKEMPEESLSPDNTTADLGYIGVDGIGIAPFKRLSGGELKYWQRGFNASFSKIHAAVEHAVAKIKTRRMPSGEGGRYRCPIDKFASMLETVTGLFFFAEYSND